MFRFTIRDLLWLMVVVAMALGWWCESRQQRIALESCWSHFHEQSSQLEIERLRVNVKQSIIDLQKTQILASEEQLSDKK